MSSRFRHTAVVGGLLTVLVVYMLGTRRSKRASKELATEERDEKSSQLIVLGCGSSTGTPRPSCLLDGAAECHVCKDAAKGPKLKDGSGSFNYRGNPSLLIRFAQPGGSMRNIQIDVGKTFQRAGSVVRFRDMTRFAATTFYPMHKVPSLDALILTHGHADAILGLDDVRGLQNFNPNDLLFKADRGSLAAEYCVTFALSAVPVFLSASTMATVKQVFSYLVEKQEGPVRRKVAALQWKIVKNFEPFEVEGLRVSRSLLLSNCRCSLFVLVSTAGDADPGLAR